MSHAGGERLFEIHGIFHWEKEHYNDASSLAFNLEVNPKGKLYLITLYSIIFESHIRVWKCGLQFKQKSPAHNLNVSHQSGKNSFQKNLLFIAEDTMLKARRQESQLFFYLFFKLHV